MSNHSAWGGRRTDVRDTWTCSYCGVERVNRSRTYCDHCRAPHPSVRPISRNPKGADKAS